MSKGRFCDTLANIVARKNRYGFASSYEWGSESKVLRRTPYGYRKHTTGEYVSNSYRRNFGWKNTYYQNALTHVSIKRLNVGVFVEEDLKEYLFSILEQNGLDVECIDVFSESEKDQFESFSGEKYAVSINYFKELEIPSIEDAKIWKQRLLDNARSL